MAASEFKNGTAPRRVKQKSSVIAPIVHKDNQKKIATRDLEAI